MELSPLLCTGQPLSIILMPSQRIHSTTKLDARQSSTLTLTSPQSYSPRTLLQQLHWLRINDRIDFKIDIDEPYKIEMMLEGRRTRIGLMYEY